MDAASSPNGRLKEGAPRGRLGNRWGERGLWGLAVAVALAVHAGGAALLLGARSSPEPPSPERARPVAVWGYMPPPPPPASTEEGSPEAPTLDSPRVAGPVAPVSLALRDLETPAEDIPAIATEPLIEPTGEISPSPQEVELLLGTMMPVPPAQAADPEGLTLPEIVPESRKEPRYPEAVRRFRLYASVLLQVLVREDGTVGEMTVLRCTRQRVGFEEAALEAVRQWRYRPATLAGHPFAAAITVKVDFKP